MTEAHGGKSTIVHFMLMLAWFDLACLKRL